MLMNPLPHPLVIPPRNARPSKCRVKRDTSCSTPRMLNHRTICPNVADRRDLDVLEFHVAVVPVREDGVEMGLKGTAERVPKHVVRQHVGEVVEASSAYHSIVEVGAGLFVPVFEPAEVKLVEDFLFGLRKGGIVVFTGWHVQKLILLRGGRIVRMVLHESILIHDENCV